MSGINNWNKQLGGQKLIKQGQSSTPKSSNQKQPLPRPPKKQTDNKPTNTPQNKPEPAKNRTEKTRTKEPTPKPNPPKPPPPPTKQQERSTRKTEYFVRTSRTGTKEAFRQITTIDFK
jgi:hypothetical protein